MCAPAHVKRIKMMKQQEIRLLACDKEVLDEADDILGDELAKLNRYSRYCYTPTEIGKSFGIEGRDLNSFLADRGVEIGKSFGIEGRDLNSFLADRGIIRWSGGRWRLNRKYMHLELTEERYRYVHGEDGRRQLRSSLVWTEKGRQFIGGLIWRQ